MLAQILVYLLSLFGWAFVLDQPEVARQVSAAMLDELLPWLLIVLLFVGGLFAAPLGGRRRRTTSG